MIWPESVIQAERERAKAEGTSCGVLGVAVLHPAAAPSSAFPRTAVPDPPAERCYCCVSSDVETELCDAHRDRLDEIAMRCSRCGTTGHLELDHRRYCEECAQPSYHNADRT